MDTLREFFKERTDIPASTKKLKEWGDTRVFDNVTRWELCSAAACGFLLGLASFKSFPKIIDQKNQIFKKFQNLIATINHGEIERAIINLEKDAGSTEIISAMIEKHARIEFQKIRKDKMFSSREWFKVAYDFTPMPFSKPTFLFNCLIEKERKIHILDFKRLMFCASASRSTLEECFSQLRIPITKDAQKRIIHEYCITRYTLFTRFGIGIGGALGASSIFYPIAPKIMLGLLPYNCYYIAQAIMKTTRHYTYKMEKMAPVTTKVLDKYAEAHWRKIIGRLSVGTYIFMIAGLTAANVWAREEVKDDEPDDRSIERFGRDPL